MTEEVRLLLPPQDLAARRHFFEEVATGGSNRFHRSTPATPLASHRETSPTKAASLTVGVVLEKCLSENSLLLASGKQTSSSSKSDSDISSAIDASVLDEFTDDTSVEPNTTLPTEEDSSCGGGEEDKMTGATGDQTVNNEGLIPPKKLRNPCLESEERKRLHKELMLNQKLGKNVLNQKSELQKAMEKYKDAQFRKELEQQRQENLSPLERVIEQRAKRLEILERNTLNEKEISPKEPEFLQIHAKLRARMDAK